MFPKQRRPHVSGRSSLSSITRGILDSDAYSKRILHLQLFMYDKDRKSWNLYFFSAGQVLDLSYSPWISAQGCAKQKILTEM